MRIGIDIDNCISNFDDVLLEKYIKHDKKLRNTGIINDKPYYITVEINKDLSYSFNKNDRKIKFVTYLDSDKIYNDLFNKLVKDN